MIRTIVAASMLLTTLSGTIYAQGSIFGEITLSDGSPPPETELRLLGYINDTDNEVRLLVCDGTGYDGNNWWDDFQNYLDEAAGLPYRYLYFATSAEEFAELSGSIPDNSFQQEDVEMSSASFPPSPEVVAVAEADAVRLNWSGCADCSYHLYRRPNGIAGSFFRLDDPSGNLSIPGVTETSYLDSDVTTVDQYEYLVVSRRSDGVFSPPPDPVSVTGGLCGDVDASGNVNITDSVYLINFIFASGPAPLDPYGGDVDCSGQLNITDAVYLVNYIFANGPAPCEGC